MRNIIYFLLLLILLLLWNIIFYFLNEEYRFFIQKIKYQNELVPHAIVLDDSPISSTERQQILDVVTPNQWDETLSLSALEFLESIATSWSSADRDARDQQLPPSEEFLEIVDLLSRFPLEEIDPNEYLFAITPEYPDLYLEWFSPDLSLYSFPTKSFSDVFDIFNVLAYELPISLNQVNNFWAQSFFINMDEAWEDDFVRIVFEYENKVFWLKIKKLHYNTVRDALKVLR